MPELPDVEVFRRYLDSTALHKKIKHIHILDERILEGDTPQSFGRKLVGRCMEETDRHGKYLFARLGGGHWISVHFGMTGSVQYFKNLDGMPDYTYARIDFENGYHLAYVIPRKLGHFRYLDSPEDLIDEKELGPDPLKADFNEDDFVALLNGRRGMVKTTLMNQSILAGIGNVYSDEILFQQRLHPRTKVRELKDKELKQLFGTMQDVLKKAIECGADPGEFPRGWLTPSRAEGEPCPQCGGMVARIVISGRGSYFCPGCQQKR